MKIRMCHILNGSILVMLTLPMLGSCKSNDDFTHPDYSRPKELTLHTLPKGDEVKMFTTTANGAYRLKQTVTNRMSGTSTAPVTLRLNAKEKYQTIDGFGFALTYSTCYNLLKMTAADRHALLQRIYSKDKGYGVSYARMSIGCSDFSSTEYTLCDKKGIENFALHSDETNYIIPILKEILSINPDLKIIGSPWTCPRWMKVENMLSLNPKNSWTDGHLNPECRPVYAEYFVRFVNAMKKQGVPVYAVTPQNEPLNRGNCASLYMPWNEEAPFVKELAGAFKKNGLKTKIYVYDHNYNYGIGNNDYPIQVYNALGNKYEGSELVVGAAYHDYGGTPAELEDIHAKAPDKELIFSESSIGTWNRGRDLSKRLIADMRNITLGTVNRQCRAVIVWNLMLDTNMGPNLDGGCQTCFGAIDINPNDYKTLSYNSHYYIITHASLAAQAGATRVGGTLSSSVKGLAYSLFLNPDDTYGALLCNDGEEELNLTVDDGKHHFTVCVPRKAVVTCRWRR